MSRIREPRLEEISLLKNIAPPYWNTDIAAAFTFHYGQPYFSPFVADENGEIVGCANALCSGSTGWLGNIIVLPEYRGQGIGSALTRRLVEFFHGRAMRHQVLVATAMGEPVYRRLGFETRSEYIFFSRERAGEPEEAGGARPLQPGDWSAVLALDRAVTGEERPRFLQRFFEDAWVHGSPDGRVDGFFLPKLGSGLVIAATDAAGLDLLRVKLNLGALQSVAPAGNRAAVDFLLARGFVETARAPRMSLGPDVDWQPEHVFARGSGFCG